MLPGEEMVFHLDQNVHRQVVLGGGGDGGRDALISINVRVMNFGLGSS